MAQEYDLVVIGLGSGGGLAAEFAAGELGLRVAAVERGRIGGDCLWTGCVPSKALIASARVAHTVRTAGTFGVTAGEPEVDLRAVWARIRSIQAGIAETDDSPDRFRELGVDLVEGSGRITGYRQVTVDTADGERRLDARYILVCTGSRPAVPPIPGLDTVGYHTNETLFEIDEPPSSLVMIGGGPIATELAQSMVRLGVPTTVLEMAHRLVPRDEPELADRLGQILRREGVDLHLSTSATAVRRGGDGVVVETDDGEFSAAGLLVATGRTANVQSLGLGELGVPVGPGGAEVDGRNRTLVPSIYVVGDAAEGRADFTHVAAHDAVLAVRDMFFPGRGAPAQLTPWCTFTDPELAHVGLTAAEARERHGRSAVTVHRHELAQNDRARADGTTDGMILVVTARDKIVGAHALAPTAGEFIHELALAIHFGAKLNELSDLVHIYPTLATGIGRIAADRSFETAEKYRSLAKLTRWMG
ncbi:dihydrolipoyl dehydrogenase family protein [Ilumatobacter sp.]|uniref:dihydrolipoyl dehydrogenase family protein n=1 Tax=Ilumatobacter sp. TaxID=1967498 RepID=UPI003AF7CF9C